MKVIEADGVRLAHIAPDEGELKALCGAKPFPARWHWTLHVTKVLCRTCVARRHGR